jgi:cation diffusion facilitator CzcD-associated flavoprotein CzcO
MNRIPVVVIGAGQAGLAVSHLLTVVEGTAVRSVNSAGGGYHVITDAGYWIASAVVVATGYCATPAVPPFAAALNRRIAQMTVDRYRNPDDPAFVRGLAVEAELAVGHVLDHLEERRCDLMPALPEAS